MAHKRASSGAWRTTCSTDDLKAAEALIRAKQAA